MAAVPRQRPRPAAARGPPGPVLVATEDDFAAFYRRSQYPDACPTEPSEGGGRRDAAVGAQTSDSWRDTRSAVKRLYEYLRRQHAITPPFELVTVTHWATGLRGTGITGYAPRRRPLAPAARRSCTSTATGS